jgi:hypothetical protein
MLRYTLEFMCSIMLYSVHTIYSLIIKSFHQSFNNKALNANLVPHMNSFVILIDHIWNAYIITIGQLFLR